MIKIHVMRCGFVGADETIPDSSKSINPLAFTGVLRGEKHRVYLPVFTYLIEHPKGKILVDTSWHTDVRTDRIKHLSRTISIASKAILPEGETVTEQLAKIGIRPEDLDMVFITHMDADHVSGLELVKNARKICTNEKELKSANGHDIRYNRNLWKKVDIKGIRMKNIKSFPHGKGLDVFGDKTVFLVELSGHSDGMTGLFIQGEKGFCIITGDSAYFEDNYKDLKLPGIVYDRAKEIRTLKWLKKMSENPRCVEILSSHDEKNYPHTVIL